MTTPALRHLEERRNVLSEPKRPAETQTAYAIRMVQAEAVSAALGACEDKSKVYTLYALNRLPEGTLLLRDNMPESRVVFEKCAEKDTIRYHDSAGWAIKVSTDWLMDCPLAILWIPEV